MGTTSPSLAQPSHPSDTKEMVLTDTDADAESPQSLEDLMMACAITGDLVELKRLAGDELASGQREDLYLEAAKQGHLFLCSDESV